MLGSRYLLGAATALSLAGTALAQPAQPSQGWGEPLSTRASNIGPNESASPIAPRLPTPAVGEDAGVAAYLMDARRSLAAGHTGQAQEAMERAESRLLDRSVDPSRVATPAADPLVGTIAEARRALGAGDRARAMHLLDTALAGPAAMPRPAYPPVPELRTEILPQPSMAGAVWEPGHWAWNGAGYDWEAGRYLPRPPQGRFVQGHWAVRGNAWMWAPAHWES